MTENTSSSSGSRSSTYVFMIILVTLALSLVSLVAAVIIYNSKPEAASFLLVIGFIAMSLSAYVLLQSRRRVSNMKIEAPQIMTTIECRKCGFKNVRAFQRGYFVYKELEKCQKCDDKLIITAIYREVKEKEKTYPF